MEFIGWDKADIIGWNKIYQLKNGDMRTTGVTDAEYKRQVSKSMKKVLNKKT